MHINECKMSVCLQGDSADCMFFVEDGEIRIAVRQSVGTSQCLVLSHHSTDGDTIEMISKCKKNDLELELLLTL